MARRAAVRTSHLRVPAPDLSVGPPGLLLDLDEAVGAGSGPADVLTLAWRHLRAALPLQGLAVHAPTPGGARPCDVLCRLGVGVRSAGPVDATVVAKVHAARGPVPLAPQGPVSATWAVALRTPEVTGLLVLHLSRPMYGAALPSGVLLLLAQHLAWAVHRQHETAARENARCAAQARSELLENGSRAVSVQEAGCVLARAATLAFRTERAGVCVIDPAGRISHAVGVGVSQELTELLARSLVGKRARDSPVWRRAEAALGPVVVTDAATSARRPGGLAEAMGFASFIAIPLLSAAGPLGLVTVGDSTRTRTWTPFEHNLAEQLALAGALVLDAARMRQTERAQLREVTYRACHDGLTGLPNREVLLDRLGPLLRPAPGREPVPTALMLLDLNDFKQVNDALGHASGDLLLSAVAGRLSGLADVDVVARLGGDEFALVVSGPEAGRVALAVADEVRARLAAPFDLDGRALHVSASVGLALHPDDASGVGALLKAADVAMYTAKRQGSTAVRYRPEMEAPALESLVVYSELHAAVREGQLRLHFQPKVDLLDGLVHGVEALVRWQHPQRGLLAPARFLPVAEATDLIHPVTAWVLRAAVAQWYAWCRQGRRLDLAVNVSVVNLRDPGFARLLDDLLVDTELARSLVIEITETAVMTDYRESTALLRRLRLRGVRISMDDFGTGQSSLTQLRRLPVDELKIDRKLVRRIGVDPVDRAVVETVVRLAQHLELDVVAEGVEDAHAVQVLRALGCRRAQGYHLARPGAAEDLLLDARVALPPVPPTPS